MRGRARLALERVDLIERGFELRGARAFAGLRGVDELLLRGERGLQAGAVGARFAPGNVKQREDAGGRDGGEKAKRVGDGEHGGKRE